MGDIDKVYHQNETILYTTRQHLIVPSSSVLSRFLVIGILIAAGVVSNEAFSHQSAPMIGGLAPGDIISLLSGLISLVLLVSIFHDYMGWKQEKYVITSSRVVRWYGLLSSNHVAIPLSRVGDVTIQQGFLGAMFRYGSVTIPATSGEEALTILFMRDPHAFKHALLDAMHGTHDPAGQPAAQAVSAGTPRMVPSSLQQSFHELAMLRDRGILSGDEFEMKKRELLNRI